ncbi:transcription antitermination factor NusB [Acholeplasma hippikon]|uniref:N utilization substance protein B homolog n=1 Tax=Acholeplasma hippikon TaxID=264636 RepID=A0A449BIA1_9MOLU|nr:transcription antitermination factor NusB [Acholeplasma hippikon]VEU82175.1 N utilization substance protein B homolog [Acholeplasma hippikon]
MTNALLEKYTKLMELLYQFEILQSFQFVDFEKADSELKTKMTEILNNISIIDDLISSNLTNYTIDRLNRVDLSIIRMSVFELMKKELPAEVVINLAVELSKIYTDLDDEKQHKFTNKLLDTIYKNL